MSQFDLLEGRIRHYWPRINLQMPKQREMIRSVQENVETFVYAGNQLGKDFTAGVICTMFFLEPWLFFPPERFRAVDRTWVPGQPAWAVHTRRVVTTSVDGDQLRNLWGEIGRLVLSASVPLLASRGGPLNLNQRDVSLAAERTEGKEPLNYMIGRVTGTGEGISGAHAAYTMLVVDEASGAQDEVYKFGQGWAKRFLIFGNPNRCHNFFYHACKNGDIA